MFGNKQKRIYFDNASGTPIDSQVFNAMEPYFIDQFHNPGSLYKEGVKALDTIAQAREKIASILKARSEEIFFVDGGTEANNIAIIGVVKKWQKKFPKKTPHIITSQIEHASVLETCRALEKEGVAVTYLSVDENGLINHKELKTSLADNTVLVSLGYVNGEIGTIQDLRGVMKMIRHYRKEHKTTFPYVHTDAVQATNYVPEIGTPQLGIDIMTINASKIYGPKKIAVLFVKTGVEIDSILFGGNQERGLRSGTENIPYIVGMERSLILTRNLQVSETKRLQKIQEYTIQQMHKIFDTIIINAEKSEKIPSIVNVTFPDLSHEEIVIRLDARGIMCSVKSACKTGEEGDSHVIKALRRGKIHTGSIRFSFGRLSSKKNIDNMLKELKIIIKGMMETRKDYYIQ